MKYQLHYYEIESFILEKDSIILSFPNGFYAEDDNGNEIKPLRHSLVFTVDRTCCPNEPLESFVSIRRINHRYNGWRDISFKQFISLFKKGNMVIHDILNSIRKMADINKNCTFEIWDKAAHNIPPIFAKQFNELICSVV